MRTLQLRFALILAGSILAIMVIATGATALVVFSGDSSRLTGIMAERIAISSELVRNGASLSGEMHRHERVAASAAPGTTDARLTAALTSALRAQGEQGAAVVTQNDALGSQPVASYQIDAERWLVAEFPRPLSLPPELWFGLGAWLALVLLGVGAIAVLTARRATRSFALLEDAIASVGADGVLPRIVETGPAEARRTAAALNRLSDRLRTTMEGRMRLVAAAGHDLRTPITRMRLRAEFLADEERESWIGDLEELELIAESAIGLVREEGAGEDQGALALGPMVTQTVADLAEAQLPVTIGTVQPATVTAGPLSLRRALRNLIINAATHGGGAEVALTTRGEAAEIVIEDRGPGIPDELIPRVFEPFFRADPARRKANKGAGLGLAIAKEIIERFGGSITIENRPGGGLRQTVTLKQVLP